MLLRHQKFEHDSNGTIHQILFGNHLTGFKKSPSLRSVPLFHTKVAVVDSIALGIDPAGGIDSSSPGVERS